MRTRAKAREAIFRTFTALREVEFDEKFRSSDRFK